MAIARWRKGDKNIEGLNKTYEDWTTDWWQWSHSMPNNGDPNDHPLRSDGSKAHIGQPIRPLGSYRPVWFCGGYWESNNSNTNRCFVLPEDRSDCSILFAVIVSGIAEDEFQPPILPLDPSPVEKIDAAYSLITDPTTTANITIEGPDFTERLHKYDLDLIIPNTVVRIWPSPGFEINGMKGPIDLGTAGYWCFLKGPLQRGNYHITLDGDAPMFGHYIGEREKSRFRLFLTYDITVPSKPDQLFH